jgi:hypothetical protein
VRAEGEASEEIPHIAPTERVDAGGRKRARKTATKKGKASAPGASRQTEEPRAISEATAVSISATAQSQDQPVAPSSPFTLCDLPFDKALDIVTAWFARLTVVQQNRALEALESANDGDGDQSPANREAA